MTSFSALLQQGNAWLFMPSAIALGALHGLEPGHSKTMMAAFIVAIRGTVRQAVLLGLAATVSHTAVVWLVALIGLHFGRSWNAETAEPYFQIASAALVMAVAGWMMWRTWRHSGHGHRHEHEHGHEHGHGEAKRIDTGHGVVALRIFETGAPPRFRLAAADGRKLGWRAEQVRLETERADGARQAFSFREAGGFLESAEEIPEPHEFVARLQLGHGHHSHDYDVEFVEHDHAHAVGEYAGLDVSAPGYQDPHELAHANDIRRRFAGRDVTTGQIVVFGLTGGLVPCPASITVLLLCLQLKQVALGATLVLCFSIGLALTMVASGVLAALSVKHVAGRWSGFGEWVRKAPYVSGALIMLVGLYLGWSGWSHLA
ncbi:nickel/cobalt efflux transporter [Chromobacterium piscinae]|uniref:nickel/cobalt efflux transporter n=1 Tax=Chromobacterium piscinae TaxID=686831 RepID=UPI001E3C5DD3|nr:nickel/cobalt efflux transporter [Chromobacterium piscinae]MCD5326269.1 nickel/cobalt efflux transporter RcnA [Chromobacterium piscinae]